jgi:predicted transcriptional regulator of viral defense system
MNLFSHLCLVDGGMQLLASFPLTMQLSNVSLVALVWVLAVQVATAEVTAVDLAGYPQHAGGFDQVATVLSELAEKIDANRLVAAAKTGPLPWAQRLGYLLELVGAKDKVSELKNYVRENARDWTPLVSGESYKRPRRAEDWLLYINSKVEPET